MPVYLDHNATTRLDPRVLEAMLPYLSGPYGNASSVHRFGRAARDAIEAARAQVANLVHCQPAEVVWTSGGTEADNLALKGATEGIEPTRVLYGATEHPAVQEAAESLSRRGWRVETIAVDGAGLIRWRAFERQLAQGPVRLVSVMAANNETGVVQDVARVAQLARAAGALTHADAVQAAGKIFLDFVALGCDLMSLSAHKLYGPRGIGALIVKRGVELFPQLHGGGQEQGLRGGTENLAAIAGFGAAAELAAQELNQRAEHAHALRERLEVGLRALPGVAIFAEAAERLPNTVQFGVPGYHSEALLMALDRKGMAVSSGSACASGKPGPSHVLVAMGIPEALAHGAVRVSLGKDNTEADVDAFLAVLRELADAVPQAVNAQAVNS